MQLSLGVQRAPKWKHVPEPPDRHVKYAADAEWYAQLGAGHGTSRATSPGFPVTGPAPPFVGPIEPAATRCPEPAAGPVG